MTDFDAKVSPKSHYSLKNMHNFSQKSELKFSTLLQRLVGWEARERRRARDWERIEAREAEQRRQMAKEARRLRDFLENYDDEKDDR